MGLRTLVRIGCATALLGSVVAFTPLVVGPAGAARTEATWQLVGHHQHACFSGNVHDGWYGVFIKGTWSDPIEVGLERLPAGGTFTTSYTPIAPGSADGEYTLAYADAKLTGANPVGRYTARLWASDGTTRDHVRVVLDVKTRCGYDELRARHSPARLQGMTDAPQAVNNEAESRFEVKVDGHLAELRYHQRGNRFVLVHTEVPGALEGRGIGGILVAAAIDHAERNGLTIVPLCPFARGWLERHPDVAAGHDRLEPRPRLSPAPAR